MHSSSTTTVMEQHRRHILPSNYPAQVSIHASRPRQPLSDSDGNGQYQVQSQYHNAPPKYGLPTPTLPSQPDHYSLHQRRDYLRKSRVSRPRNPISESREYQAYRQRQLKSDIDGDQKWSPLLEEAFLEALDVIPNMGRRKFTLGGKLHGRNELISLYLWFAYQESLPPGQTPDPTMKRSRKQVSSHIQVLKGFMRHHPQFERLFPGKDTPPKNGFETPFKNDECLRALAMGRLPRRRNQQAVENVPSMMSAPQHKPIRPTVFTMSMKSPSSTDPEKLVTSHEYCSPPLRAAARDSIETIPNWRSRFPALESAIRRNDLHCDIVHIDVTLNLSSGIMPSGSELFGSIEVLAPSSGDDDFRAEWRCTSSLYKPQDLYGEPDSDPRYDGRSSQVSVENWHPTAGSHMRVPFLANPWAYALVKLAEMEAIYLEAQAAGQPMQPHKRAREYIGEISSYQELLCSQTPGAPWTRRAVIICTFTKAQADVKGSATWRYLDAAPRRSQVFEPQPLQHMYPSTLNENLDWAEPPMHIQPPPAQYENMMHGLATPPHTGVLASPFAPSYVYPPQAPSMAPNDSNISFMSHDTQESVHSDSTLVESQSSRIGSQSQPYMETNVHTLDYEHNGQTLWNVPSIQGLDHSDPNMFGYGDVVPTGQPVPWEAKGAPWDGSVGDFTGMSAYNPNLRR